MISAVVLAYNRCAEVLLTIAKLKDYQKNLPFELEIIVVDNASNDDTSFKIKNAHPDIQLITKVKNNGIAGWNDGFQVARHKYILVLDDDSHPFSGIEEAVLRMDQNPDIGILPFQIKDPAMGTDPDLDPEEAWKDGDDVVGFIGCGALIRRKLYEDIGGYAEWIYLYTHEFEYGIRCLDAGYRINFFGKGVIIHRTSSINRSNKRIRVFATRNELLIVHKYFAKDKFKYLLRVLVNNMKFAKREGVFSAYYVFLGYCNFLKIKCEILVTPVSIKTQQYFADNFWSTKPIFSANKKQMKTSNTIIK